MWCACACVCVCLCACVRLTTYSTYGAQMYIYEWVCFACLMRVDLILFVLSPPCENPFNWMVCCSETCTPCACSTLCMYNYITRNALRVQHCTDTERTRVSRNRRCRCRRACTQHGRVSRASALKMCSHVFSSFAWQRVCSLLLLLCTIAFYCDAASRSIWKRETEIDVAVLVFRYVFIRLYHSALQLQTSPEQMFVDKR